MLARLVVNYKLTRGSKGQFIYGDEKTLGINVKNTHSVYLVVKKFNSYGVRALVFRSVTRKHAAKWGIQVNYTSAAGKLSRAVNHLHSHVSCVHKLFCKHLGLDPRIVVKRNGVALEHLHGHCKAESRVGRGEDDVVRAADYTRKHLKPLMLVLMRGADVMKVQVTRAVKRRALAEFSKSIAKSHALLLLRADNKRGKISRLFRVLNERKTERVSRARTKTARKYGKRLILEVLLYCFQKLTVFAVSPDAIS